MLIQLRQSEALVRHVVDAPNGPPGEFKNAAKGQPEGNGEAGAQIALPVAARDAVDGEHHHVDARRLGPLHHCAVQATILMEIELIDLRRVVRLAQLLDSHRPKRRYAEHGPEFRGRSSDSPLSVMMKQTLQRCRRAVERRCELLAHHGDRHIDALNAAQDFGNQVAALEACRISAMRHLVVGGAIDVAEDGARQPPPRKLAKVMEVMAIAEPHPHPAVLPARVR